VLLASARLPVAVPWPQLAQAHGQVQALGFRLLFIVAVGMQLFSRFLGAPLLYARTEGNTSSKLRAELVAGDSTSARLVVEIGEAATAS
jgi:hypothetical protein